MFNFHDLKGLIQDAKVIIFTSKNTKNTKIILSFLPNTDFSYLHIFVPPSFRLKCNKMERNE